MSKWAVLYGFVLMGLSTPALAERQTYNPYTIGVTQYQLERAQARQQRAALAPPQTRARRSAYRHVSSEEANEVLAIDRAMKQRFPIHPGLYRDAYDRGTFRRHSTGGNNPGD